jgi:hypothetical protein
LSPVRKSCFLPMPPLMFNDFLATQHSGSKMDRTYGFLKSLPLRPLSQSRKGVKIHFHLTFVKSGLGTT